MKLKEMIPEVRYVVTKGGSTLQKGDNIWLDFDGSLMCLQGGGWLMPQEWRLLRNEVELDTTYYEKEIDKYRAKIKLCEGLIKKYGGESCTSDT